MLVQLRQWLAPQRFVLLIDILRNVILQDLLVVRQWESNCSHAYHPFRKIHRCDSLLLPVAAKLNARLCRPLRLPFMTTRLKANISQPCPLPPPKFRPWFVLRDCRSGHSVLSQIVIQHQDGHNPSLAKALLGELRKSYPTYQPNRSTLSEDQRR